MHFDIFQVCFCLLFSSLIRGDEGFDVETACCRIDSEMLKRARHKYAAVVESKANKPSGSQASYKGSHKGQGKTSSKSHHSHGILHRDLVFMLYVLLV